MGHKDIDLEALELRRQLGELIIISLGPAKFNGDVLPVD